MCRRQIFIPDLHFFHISHMNFVRIFSGKFLATLVTFKQFFSSMNSHMFN
eukprot:01445.XXX_598_747_1 [CDS] Oithona nana genome sequencing.